MMRRMLLPTLLLVLALAGCGSSPKTQFIVLSQQPGPAVAAGGRPIDVRNVIIPGAIDRQELVRANGPNGVRIDDIYRWAGPLDQMIQTTLAADLASRLPSGMVLMPGDPVPNDAQGVALTVDRFLDEGGGRVVLVADWSLLRGSDQHVVQRQRSHITVAAPGDGGQAIAAAMSRALGQLADRMASAIGG